MHHESITNASTAGELERLAPQGTSTELVRGRSIAREPSGTQHGRVAANLSSVLSDFVRRNRLGHVFAQETRLRIASRPDVVRAPDVAFVTQTRIALVSERGSATLAPELVAEVVAPEDRPGELLVKVGQWLDAGATMIWVVDPSRAQARVFRADGSLTIIGADASLEGEDVLPGFVCALADLLR